jgi:hypothetical protein
MDPAWIVALTALAGVLAGLLTWVGRTTWRVFRKTDQFLEDWNGIPADRGHEARAGVMERLARLEHQVNDVQAQVHLNSGHSLRDVVTRTEEAVGRLESSVKQIKDRP